MIIKTVILLITLFSFTASQGQIKNKDMHNNTSKNSNPLLCDIETGMCETTDENTNSSSKTNQQSTEKSVKLIYYTDPICSSCWGIEPRLRKLKLEYGNAVDIDYRIGGLLPDWSL